MDFTVRNNGERSRYELLVDGDLAGVAEYRPAGGGRIVIPHTEIDPGRRGHGLGAVLVKGALDDLRAAGLTVVPQCWYVAQYIDEHPEYRELVAV